MIPGQEVSDGVPNVLNILPSCARSVSPIKIETKSLVTYNCQIGTEKLPGNNGYLRIISANIHPIAQMSTPVDTAMRSSDETSLNGTAHMLTALLPAEYKVAPNSSSGARYQL